MSRNDTEPHEALDLDQRWDELNAGNPALRRLDRGDQELRELVALDASETPRPEFVSDLMGQIWAEARQISVIGELDLIGAEALQHVLAGTVGSGLPFIVLDLSTCGFLDADALGVIKGMHVQLAANGQELVIHGATGQVGRLIELARAISPQGWVNEPEQPAAGSAGSGQLTEASLRPTEVQR